MKLESIGIDLVDNLTVVRSPLEHHVVPLVMVHCITRRVLKHSLLISPALRYVAVCKIYRVAL